MEPCTREDLEELNPPSQIMCPALDGSSDCVVQSFKLNCPYSYVRNYNAVLFICIGQNKSR